MHLAEWYYGESSAWMILFWANQDVYGDDFEKIPVGTPVFIPQLETTEATFRYRGSIFAGTDCVSNINPPVPQPVSFNPYEFIPNTATGFPNLALTVDDGSVVYTGRGGVAIAEETLQVNSGSCSSALGDSIFPLVGDPAKVEYAGTHRGLPKVKREDAGNPFIGNVIREMAEQYYGHSKYYWKLLKANNLKPWTIVYYNQRIVFPARGRDIDMEAARRWRS